VIVLAGMQRVEIGDAIDAEDHGFTVDDEMLLPDLPMATFFAPPAANLGTPGTLFD
jgi:hypothetical protein